MTPSNSEVAGGLPWCIAGGYAACPQLASDMDVWIYGISSPELVNAREDILLRHPDIAPQSTENVNDGSSQTFDTGFDTLKVGRLGERHILVTSAKSIEELLGGFDVSTHQCALDESGGLVRGAKWTPVTEPPVMIKDGGENTPKRMEKIASRYRHFATMNPLQGDDGIPF